MYSHTVSPEMCGSLSQAYYSSLYCVSEQQRLWQDCADAQSHLSLCCLSMWLAPFSHELAQTRILKALQINFYFSFYALVLFDSNSADVKLYSFNSLYVLALSAISFASKIVSISINEKYSGKKVQQAYYIVAFSNVTSYILKAKSSFTAYIYTKKLLAICPLKSWEFLL